MRILLALDLSLKMRILVKDVAKKVNSLLHIAFLLANMLPSTGSPN